MDAAATDGQRPSSSVGVPIILPSSFTGGPRYVQQQLMDALSLARRFGHPSLFITFTCNPKWPEVLAGLDAGEAPTERPDVVVNVFQRKFRALMKDLTSSSRRVGQGYVFGRVLAYTWVIEFQKRGLPHAHILLILHPSFLIRSAADVDSCCRTEIPDPTVEPELHRLVSDNMLHGPCSADATPLPPCRQANPQECRFGSPKSFVDESSLDDDSYATYRRRNDGAKIVKRRSNAYPLFTYTNRDVVPYNPFLLLRYRCHCNVEICSSIKAYKYMFKYIYKGPDKATAELSAASNRNGAAVVVDEIRQYVDSRYFSATEALWRFYRFSVDGRYPAVVRLALHEQGLQPVLFQAVGSLAQAVFDAHVQAAAVTTLTGFFSFNASVKARLAAGEPVGEGERRATFDTLYQDWPEALRWGSAPPGAREKKCWSLRSGQGKPAIGRMYSCGPAAGEKFYLRILLLHVLGFSGFDDAKTVDGRTYDTFRQACIVRALISDDRDMDLALAEAVHFASGYQQRLLFVYIAVYGETANLEGHWTTGRWAKGTIEAGRTGG
ncbi:putative atp-dependent dna helicase pif1 protein [Neofusicoccum parvum UCRNP2]|uniref:Putative atp-dependent dna helicase pif1 protein n=1 Tax=Botryosphaeria parva (strain UCR-NP2) TaxID=1287680 RepID=R1EYM8_BOTPV|nr:putative atp-dependent dna helicase pif1 protein [Neofusicoccum parvum UCRNP2]